MNSSDLESIYDQRFSTHISYRKQVWKILVSKYEGVPGIVAG